MKRICVFCGSSPGSGPEYLDSAKQLGYTLASKNIGLVYGGARAGIMRKIAESVLEKGGEVIGVIPKGLVEVAPYSYSEYTLGYGQSEI